MTARFGGSPSGYVIDGLPVEVAALREQPGGETDSGHCGGVDKTGDPVHSCGERMTEDVSSSGPVVVLRPFQDKDLEFFTTLARDERVTRFVGDGRPWSADQIDERTRPALRKDPTGQLGAARWYIAEVEGQSVGLFVSTRREQAIEVGYWVSPLHWGRGVAGAMLDRAVEVLPSVYGTPRLSARVSPDNTASARVLTRRFFTYQGHLDGLDLYSRN
jgi:ribosomal-protein-alanine N-acetyltransferase